MAEYSQWWEAFAGGEFGGPGEWSAFSPGIEDYEERTESFYSQIVGPSVGYTPDPETGETFGQIFGENLTYFDTEAMQQAEETFRLSIGDPYGGALQDPYAWEYISRMSPDEAQEQLAGTLYGAGEYIGGTTGATYGTSMATGKEAYTSGLTAEREGLTYGGLTGSQSLISGTSGAVLRSGEGIMQAEDVLAEAYKKSKDLGAGYMETQETAQISLEENLNDALTIYLDAVNTEKESWFDDIMFQVTFASSVLGADLGGEEASFEQAGEWDVGWEYEEGLWAAMGEEWEEGYLAGGQGGCGVGELWDPETNQCQPYEGLPEEDQVSGCTDSQAENYNPEATVDDGSCADDYDCSVTGCPPGEVCSSYNGNCYDPTPGQAGGPSWDISGGLVG